MPSPRSKAVRLASRIASRASDAVRFPFELRAFCAAARRSGDLRAVPWGDLHPRFGDRTSETRFDRHYVYHPAWALRCLLETRPAEHIDIASTLHFVAMASAVVPVRFLDYRPAPLKLAGLTTGHADLTKLDFPSASVPSLSCMHVVEHVGLGRYGDPIDPQGDRTAMRELARVVAPGGNLFFVVPVGRERVCFNAHRVYAFDTVVGGLAGLTLRRFDLLPDGPYDAGLVVDADPALVARQEYGCGCFWFGRD